MATTIRISLLVVALCSIASVASAAGTVQVDVRRIPDGGVQPQAAVDAKGIVHLIYLKGDPAKCDVLYARSTDGGSTWSDPLRVNSQPASAIAMGTVRG